MSGANGSLQGSNLYVYCFNNPVSLVDSSGNWPKWVEDAAGWVDDNIIQPAVNFVQNVAEDISNYDPNNESEDVVFSSNYFSNYKGAVVIKTPFDSSFSFGFIGLSIYQQNSSTLNHEYGHTVQMKNMGVLKYTFDVAIPSIAINVLDRMGNLPYDYYTYPFEAEADKLGSTKNHQKDKDPLPQGEYDSFWSLIPLFFK